MGTTGTPVGTPPVPIGAATITLAASRPLPHTWLSLERYGRMIPGLSPVHFHGANAPIALPANSSCREVVPRHGWQFSGETSREEIATRIREAELEIAEHIGFYLAPDYTVEEQVDYTSDYYRDSYFRVTGLYGLKDVALRWGRVILPGRWSPTLIDTATVDNGGITFLDLDADGFYETVRVSATTSLTDARKVGVFFTGGEYAPEWQIRYPYKASIASGVYTAYFHSWMLLDPDKDSAFPGSDYSGLDIETDTSNFAGSVDVCDISTDTISEHLRINYQQASAVSAAEFYYDTGTFFLRNATLGLVVPAPATYDVDTESWTAGSFTHGTPSNITVSYFSGHQSDPYLAGRTMDPLSDLYARAIAEMATSRLDRPPCGCPENVYYHQKISTDLASSDESISRFTVDDINASRFGTRAGEVSAWRLIASAMKTYKKVGVAVI